MGWPDNVEFAAFLQASGLRTDPPSALQSLLDLDDLLDTAVEQWEDLTAWWPFVAGPVATTRSFAYPGSRILLFDTGIPANTTVTLYANATDTTSDTTTQNTQWRLWPIDAPNRGRPYTGIEFLQWVGYAYNTHLDINARWGYCTEENLPRSARRALMALAAMEGLPQLLPHLASGVVRWTEGDVTKQFANPDAIRALWQAQVDVALKSIYKRIRVG